MTNREVMQQALEALERYSGVDQRACDAEDALRTALEQPEQEPVAIPDCGEAGHADGACGNRECLPSFKRITTPPAAARKPLTDDHIWKLLLENEPTRYEAFRLCESAHGIKEPKP